MDVDIGAECEYLNAKTRRSDTNIKIKENWERRGIFATAHVPLLKSSNISFIVHQRHERYLISFQSLRKNSAKRLGSLIIGTQASGTRRFILLVKVLLSPK